MKPLLLTGAAGDLGTHLRARLAKEMGPLRSTDIAKFGPAYPNEQTVRADLADAKAIDKVVAGCRAIIHFGGISREDTFERLCRASFLGTYNVFDAARRFGIQRVIVASSNHAIGFHPTTAKLDADSRQRPDSIYGLSKCFAENIASYYVDKFDMDVAALRIGSALSEPNNIRALSTWLSYDDLFRLLKACIEAPRFGYTVLYGVSNNDRSWWDNAKSPIDYRPQDNAEKYRAKLMPGADPRDPEAPDVKFQGGMYCSYGWRNGKKHPTDPADLAAVAQALRVKLKATRVAIGLDVPIRNWQPTRALIDARAPRVPPLSAKAQAALAHAIAAGKTDAKTLSRPVMINGKSVGWIAAASAKPRAWSVQNFAALEAAAAGVAERLT